MTLWLAWRPFLDPLDLHDWWWAFLLPLSFGIAVTYKAVRLDTFADYWRQVIKMTAQIILGMVLLWIGAFLFLEYVLPVIVPME